MGFKAKIAEETARQLVTVVSKEAGKHLSKKAVDHTLSGIKTKAIATYESVKSELTGERDDGSRLTTTLTPTERMLLAGWWLTYRANHAVSEEDRALHEKLGL
jgi:hypothetical protein